MQKIIPTYGLTKTQIVFVKKVIDYIVQNGYIENVSELIKDNAVKIVG